MPTASDLGITGQIHPDAPSHQSTFVDRHAHFQGKPKIFPETCISCRHVHDHLGHEIAQPDLAKAPIAGLPHVTSIQISRILGSTSHKEDLRAEGVRRGTGASGPVGACHSVWKTMPWGLVKNLWGIKRKVFYILQGHLPPRYTNKKNLQRH